MEEQTSPKSEEKYFHIENIGKNFGTTIAGLVLMGIAIAAIIMDWFLHRPTGAAPWQIGLVFVAGFALLFMRDNIKSYIDIYTKKKIS